MEALPILWRFALGPLLSLEQFQAFMTLIKSLSSRIEHEHTRKLQELSSSNGGTSTRSGAKQPAAWNASTALAASNGEEVDFASLVSGRKSTATPDMMNEWGPPAAKPPTTQFPATSPAPSNSNFSSWISSVPAQPARQPNTLSSLQSSSQHRTVTPDQSLNTAFAALTPASPFNAPLQPAPRQPSNLNTFSSAPLNPTPANTSINWSAAATPASTWSTQQRSTSGGVPPPQLSRQGSAFSLPPPPGSGVQTPVNGNAYAGFSMPVMQPQQQQQQNGQKSGLDKYQSLI